MKKYILESTGTHGWGWTGLESDSLAGLMADGRAYAAKHHADRVNSMTAFRVVERGATRNPTTGQYNADVVAGQNVWHVEPTR